MLDGVADAITVQSPDHKLIYANEAAHARSTASRTARRSTTSRPTTYLQRFEVLDDAGRAARPRAAARAARARGPRPRAGRRCASRRPHDRRGPLGADQVDRGPRPRRRRAARDQRDRGHHRAQALRGGAAVPGRGVAAARAASLDYERTLAAVAELAVPGARRRRARSCSPTRRELPAGGARGDADGRGVGSSRTRMIVPMTAAGRVIGTITLSSVTSASTTRQDVLVAEDFGLRAGAAVENARLYRAASRDRARRCRPRCCRRILPDIPGAMLAAAYHPARAGARGRRRLLRRVLDRARASGTSSSATSAARARRRRR